MAENILEIRTKVRMAQWQIIIKECKESGRSVTKFCEDRNISCHHLRRYLPLPIQVRLGNNPANKCKKVVPNPHNLVLNNLPKTTLF